MTPYCDRLRQNFNDLYDGTLSPLVARLVHKHLETCDACREEYRVFTAAVAAVRNRTAPDVPPHVLRNVVENLTRPKGGAPGFVPGIETP